MLTGNAPTTLSWVCWDTFGLLKFRVTWGRFHFLIGTWCVFCASTSTVGYLFREWEFVCRRSDEIRPWTAAGSPVIALNFWVSACKQVRLLHVSGAVACRCRRAVMFWHTFLKQSQPVGLSACTLCVQSVSDSPDLSFSEMLAAWGENIMCLSLLPFM